MYAVGCSLAKNCANTNHVSAGYVNANVVDIANNAHAIGIEAIYLFRVIYSKNTTKQKKITKRGYSDFSSLLENVSELQLIGLTMLDMFTRTKWR